MMSLCKFYFNLDKIPTEHKIWFSEFINLIIDKESFSILPKKAPENWFKYRNKVEYYNRFIELTAHLPQYTFGDRIKCLIQGFWSTAPICKCCGSAVKLITQSPFTPRPFCSISCSSRFEGTKSKSRNTCIARYGVDNIFKSEKFKTTIKQSLQDRYGVNNISQVDDIKKKKIATSVINYGVNHPLQCQEVKDKSISTNLDRYGFDNPQKNPRIHAKTKKTLIDRYGVNNINQIHISKNSLQKLDDYEWLQDQYNVKKHSAATIASILGDVTYHIVLARCREFGFEINYNFSSSSQEQIIIRFIQSILPNVDIQTNVRDLLPSKKEIDIYLPDYKFAIEVNGLYWHSNIDSDYHQKKKLEAMSIGIDLMMITDFDIKDFRIWNILQSIIRCRLGIFDKKLMARKLLVKAVAAKDAKSFLDANHLHGYVHASYHYALYDSDEIVMIASFGIPRFDSKTFDYELIRLSSKIGYIITGGFEKVITAFRLKHNGSLMSYVDLDYFSGKSFKGWKFIKITSPSYIWTNGSKKLSRYQTQKHKLEKLLSNEIYDPTESETINMRKAAYLQYFNSGNAVYSLL